MIMTANMGRSSLSTPALSGQGSIEWIVIVGLVIALLATAWNVGINSAVQSLWTQIVTLLEDLTTAITVNSVA